MEGISATTSGDQDTDAEFPFNPSLSSCPLSDDGDTAFSENMSTVTDDLEELTINSKFLVGNEAGSIDEDRRSSIGTADSSDVQQLECGGNQLKLFLPSSSIDEDWGEKRRPCDTYGKSNTSRQLLTSGDSESEFECLTVRRSTSLKTYKTPPGSPHRKKEVRFADVLGLDLESVRHIINSHEPPVVPASAMRHLHVDSESPTGSTQQRKRRLRVCFPLPGLSPNFAARVAERHVALHSFRAEYDVLSGTVCVANVAYEKRVTIRYTFNAWATFSDVIATYVDGSNTGSTDLFRFSIQLPEFCGIACNFVEFSIMYNAGSNNQVFWDSNYGSNYRVDCYFE